MKATNDRIGRTTPDISPISATPSPTTGRSPPFSSSGSKKYSSNLPIPKNNLKKFWKLPTASKDSPDSESSTVRWDEYSGEPTESERGKPPSATPGSVRLNESPLPGTLDKSYGTSTHISGGATPARKRVGSREITEAPVLVRPEWKGAGGRHSIVKPVFDKPLPPGQSSRFPAGSHKQLLEQQERERREQEQKDAEQAERERLERERAEEERQLREQHEAEEERRLREQEQAETERLANERAQQDERERERERQQRLHRERIEQAKRGRERMQQEQVNDRANRQRAPEPLRILSGKSLASGPPEQAVPTPSHILDAIEAQNANTSPNAESESSSEATTPLVRDSKTRVASLATEDRRSPLARNPSHEELKDRRNQALPSLPSNSSRQPSPNPPPVHEQSPPSILYNDFPARDSSLNDTNHIESRFHTNLQHMSLYEQPQSRFSNTTVATTAYENNSPPQTPEMSSDSQLTITTPSSILNRKRPVAPSGLNLKRKPTPSEMPVGTTNGITRKDSKSLPKPPADAPIENPVQILQAKKDVLRRRRRNLETVIHELTNVVQPSSIAYDRASRAEIKKTVQGLEKELAEVVKDEHETGLKLHRAWKRHDDYAAYEPTSIWVRRVTT